jgi:hypothetical protein
MYGGIAVPAAQMVRVVVDPSPSEMINVSETDLVSRSTAARTWPCTKPGARALPARGRKNTSRARRNRPAPGTDPGATCFVTYDRHRFALQSLTFFGDDLGPLGSRVLRGPFRFCPAPPSTSRGGRVLLEHMPFRRPDHPFGNSWPRMISIIGSPSGVIAPCKLQADWLQTCSGVRHRRRSSSSISYR